MSFVIGTDYF